MLRAIFFLLILTNLLVWTWGAGYFSAPSNPDAIRLSRQLNPEKIQIVSKTEPPLGDTKSDREETPKVVSAPEKPDTTKLAKKEDVTDNTTGIPTPEAPISEKPSVTAPPKVETTSKKEICVLYKDLPILKASVLERVVKEKFRAFSLRMIPTYSKASFWIYIPPLANRLAAEKKVSELKALGVTEYFIVQENSANNLAVSLGLFSTKEAAESYLAELQSKGVRSARLSERTNRPVATSLEIRGPADGAEDLKKALSGGSPPAFPSECEAP